MADFEPLTGSQDSENWTMDSYRVPSLQGCCEDYELIYKST